MKLSDLTRDEQLALGGLLRLLVRADGEFSVAEEERIDSVGDALGGRELFWKIISDSAQALRTDQDVRRAGLSIARPEARELVLRALTSVAAADTISPAEQGILDALRVAWGEAG